MINRLIIFLIRVKLGVKAWEMFRFTNQKDQGWYWFTQDALWKETANGKVRLSRVSLKWLLDDECKVEILN